MYQRASFIQPFCCTVTQGPDIGLDVLACVRPEYFPARYVSKVMASFEVGFDDLTETPIAFLACESPVHVIGNRNVLAHSYVCVPIRKISLHNQPVELAAYLSSTFVMGAVLFLRPIHERVTQSGLGAAYLQVPSVAVTMSDAEKAAVMGYCADQRVPLSELVASELQEFAAELCADE
jgi:hypothetical protein